MIGNRDEKIIKEFGKKLKILRTARKLSVRKLALEADMDWSQVHRIEKGESNPTLTTIMILADALQVDPCSLLPSKK